MRQTTILLLLAGSCFAGSTCTAVKSGNFNDPTVWGSCPAAGGTSVSWRGTSMTIASGVPGAAASKDRIVIPAGFVIHTGGTGVRVELGDATSGAAANALTINATSSSSYGALVVDAGDSLVLRGYNNTQSAKGLLIGQPWSVLQVMPGANLITDAGIGNVAEVAFGRLYIGCGDTVKAPTPFCSQNAGAWVTAGTGGITATLGSTLPTLNVGDLVEFMEIPQPVLTGTGQYGPPYAPIGANRLPAAPTPSLMPLTSDTGYCGSFAPCSIVQGQPLCVVSTSPLTVGRPTNVNLSCSGATALTISTAGTGPLWLIKPAFFGGDPGFYAWNNAASVSAAATPWFDAVTTPYGLNSIVSNAAGTGPATPGDSSWSLSAISVTPTSGSNYTSLATRKLYPWQVAVQGDYSLNEDMGVLWVWGGHAAITPTASWTTLSTDVGRTPVFNPGQNGTGTGAGYELMVENADLRFLFGYIGSGAIVTAGLTSSANNQLRWEGNSHHYTNHLLKIGGAGTATAPLPVDGNGFYNSPGSNGSSWQVGLSNGAYPDISNNFVGNPGLWINNLGNGYTSTTPNITVTNNMIYSAAFYSAQPAVTNITPDILIQRNRVIYPATGNAYPETAYALNGTSGHKGILEWNYFYAPFRPGAYASNAEIRYNFLAFAGHHGWTAVNDFSYVNNVSIHHELQAGKHYPGGNGGCVDMGYNAQLWIDQITVDHITCIGSTSGGISLSDPIDNASWVLVTGAKAYDNIVQTDNASGTGFGKLYGSTPGSGQSQLLYGGYNAFYGAGPVYGGAGAGYPANIVNPEFNRTITVTKGGLPYNLPTTAKNVTGVALQNANVTSVASGTLNYTYTSASNATLSWNSGSGVGAAVQLNWGGAATVYTVASATAVIAGAEADFGVAGLSATDRTSSCPNLDFAVMQPPSAAAGKVYALGACSSTSHVSVYPDAYAAGARAGDTFVIIKSETRLFDSGATNYVDAAPDPRLLPTTTASDAGISIALSDYCASGCASSVSTGLTGVDSSDITWNSSNSPLLSIPWPTVAGGNPEAAFSPTGSYAPGAGTINKGHDGGPLGAVAPAPTKTYAP